MGRESGELGGGVSFSLGFLFSFFLFLPRCDLLRNTGLTGSAEAPHRDAGHTLRLRIPKIHLCSETGTWLIGPSGTLVFLSDRYIRGSHL